MVYHAAYNVKFLGIEKLHPFDSTKFEKVVQQLEKEGLIKQGQVRAPAVERITTEGHALQ